MLDPDHLTALALAVLGAVVALAGISIPSVRARWAAALTGGGCQRCTVRPGAVCDWCRPGSGGAL
jgi:hypothetical protein